MVIESLTRINLLARKPWIMAGLAALYASVAIILSLWVFPSDPSLSMVFLSTMAAIPIFINSLRREEEEDIKVKNKAWLVGEHKDIVGIFLFTFLGLLLTFTAWYILLPEQMTSLVFSTQINTINSINSSVSGRAVNPDILRVILLNNLKVMGFCILFSLVYGAGALFIITWNASVLGTAIGNAIRTGLSDWTSYFTAVPMGFGKYMLHGLPEMVAFLLASIAGGIISAAVIRHRHNSKKFKEVMLDSLDLIILSAVLIIASGLIEVYISAAL